MLSSVLNSPTAIQVNIAIMRAFVSLRRQNNFETEIREELKDLWDKTNETFKIVFIKFNEIDESLKKPLLEKDRKRIGVKKTDD
jgi:hypothetical protein